MRPRLGDLVAFLASLALALGCFARLVAQPGGLIVDGRRPSIDHTQRVDIRVLGNDLTYVFLPHYGHVAREIARHGRLPQWDTSGFAGRPMVGNPQGGLFYPPVWLAWWSRSPAALGWLTIGHLLWGGLGTYVLARGLRVGRVAATVAAGCFQASPCLLAHTFEGHYPHVWAACWYPWAFWAFGHSRKRHWRGTLLLPPILALMFLTGHPQEWYYLVFALSVWAAADAIQAVRKGRTQAALVAPAVWAGIVAWTLGLVAVELVPDIAAQRWTLRSSRLALGRMSNYQLHAANLLQLLDPAALGGPADYFGHDNYWETVLSIGLVPLVLASIAVARHPDRALVRGWLVLIVAALVFAAGRRFGLYPLLFELVPGMDRFRVPSRSLFLATLGAATLAGLGVETLALLAPSSERWRELERRVRHLAVLVVAGLIVGQGFVRGHGPHPAAPTDPVKGVQRPLSAVHAMNSSQAPGRDHPPRASRPTAGQVRGCLAASRLVRSGTFWFALAGTLTVLALGRWREDNRRIAAWGLGILALVELGLHGHAIIRVTPAARFLGADPISRELARAEPPVAGPFRIRARDILYHDLRASWNGFEKVNINDSFQIQHAADLYETLYVLLYVLPPPNPDDPMSEAVAQFRRAVRQGVLDRMGVAFLVSDHVEPEPAWPLVVSGTWDGARFAIHRNPTALPRAYVVPRACPARDESPAVVAQFRQIDPRQAVLMPSDPLGPGGPRQPFTPAEWTSADPDHPVIQVTTEAPGLLVVADTWMPGWTARVDGCPAPILRGNHAQRVIPLPQPGRHEVTLSYSAPGLACGLTCTIVAALGWLAACLAAYARLPQGGGLPHPSGDTPPCRSIRKHRTVNAGYFRLI